MAANTIIGDGGKKNSHVVTGVHHTRAHFAALLGPFFRYERSAHRPFTANADSREQAIRRQLPHARGERPQESKKRIAENRQHQGAHAAKFVGKRSPQERESPTDQKKREQDAAVKADIRLRGCDVRFRQQFAQRRHHHECVDERVHAVNSPSSPGSPEAANLIACQTCDVHFRTARFYAPRRWRTTCLADLFCECVSRSDSTENFGGVLTHATETNGKIAKASNPA